MRCQAKFRGKILPENRVSYQHPALPDPSNRTLSPKGTPGWCHPTRCTIHLPSITLICFTFNDTCNNRTPSPGSHLRCTTGRLKQHKKRGKKKVIIRCIFVNTRLADSCKAHPRLYILLPFWAMLTSIEEPVYAWLGHQFIFERLY